MIVRPATAADAPLLPEIERSAAAAFATLPELAWIVGEPVMAEARHAELIATGTSWVAVADGPVGFLAASRQGADLHVLELAVSADHQRRGIGKALIATAADYARSAGVARLTLTTFRDVVWNGPFYARLGFIDASGEARLAEILRREGEAGLTGRIGMALRL